MGKYVSGINGAFTGKIGNTIGSSWRGIPYMKSRSHRTKPATEGEKINRFIFGMTQQWLKPIKEYLRIGFNNYTLTNQGVNAAKSFLYKNALIKDGFNSTIDPTLVKVSHGDLPFPATMDVELKSDNTLIFNWDPHCNRENNQDQVMLLAYDIERGNVATKVLGQFRETGRDEIGVSNLNNFVVYAAFVSADRNSQSDSVYLGSFTAFEMEETKEKTDSESKAKGENAASSPGTAGNKTSEEAPEIEEVPKNQLSLFEAFDEEVANQVEHLQDESRSVEKSLNKNLDSKETANESPNSLNTDPPVNQDTENPNITPSEDHSDIPVPVDSSTGDENQQKNGTLSEIEADSKQEVPEKHPLTKSKNPEKQKFTYTNPNVEPKNATAKSADTEGQESDERVVFKKGKVTYITSKKLLEKTKGKGIF